MIRIAPVNIRLRKYRAKDGASCDVDPHIARLKDKRSVDIFTALNFPKIRLPDIRENIEEWGSSSDIGLRAIQLPVRRSS